MTVRDVYLVLWLVQLTLVMILIIEAFMARLMRFAR